MAGAHGAQRRLEGHGLLLGPRSPSRVWPRRCALSRRTHGWWPHRAAHTSHRPPPSRLQVRTLSKNMAAEHGTWVFGPVIDMLETVGYVPGKSIRAFPYDWRCPPCKLQERDGYFTGAMEGIEELYAENQGCKVVIIGHSMGCKMTHYFCRWVATHPLGKARGGVQWLEKHIESMVALGGLPRRAVLRPLDDPGQQDGARPLLERARGPRDGAALGSAPWLLLRPPARLAAVGVDAVAAARRRRRSILSQRRSRRRTTRPMRSSPASRCTCPPGREAGHAVVQPVKGTNPYFDTRFQFAVDDPNCSRV